MLSRIYVNKHIITRNRIHGTNDPPLVVATYKTRTPAFEVEFFGKAKLVYRPDRPLSCGATVWIETEDGVSVVAGEHPLEEGSVGDFSDVNDAELLDKIVYPQ